MLFWLESRDNELDIDVAILKDNINHNFQHTYSVLDINEANDYLDSMSDIIKNVIPVGTIDFVGQFLNKVHGVKTMNPIEVPDVLRQYRYLKRKYSIVDRSELPAEGYYFTKYVSKLKVFTHIGLIETLRDTADNNVPFLQDGLYQVSEVVDILAEYRCFVHNDNLVAINYYDGDCTVFPDVSLIKTMISNYMLDGSRPKAYTMDIAVIKNRGTAILEVHPWVSVGLYGYMFGSSLPYCYRDGLYYYIICNKEIKKWSNFA